MSRLTSPFLQVSGTGDGLAEKGELRLILDVLVVLVDDLLSWARPRRWR